MESRNVKQEWEARTTKILFYKLLPNNPKVRPKPLDKVTLKQSHSYANQLLNNATLKQNNC